MPEVLGACVEVLAQLSALTREAAPGGTGSSGNLIELHGRTGGKRLKHGQNPGKGRKDWTPLKHGENLIEIQEKKWETSEHRNNYGKGM